MNDEHVEIEELIAAYAVHALEVEERAQVQTEILEHIAGCDPCRTLFRALNELSGELALAAPPARVSEELETRVMEAARGERLPAPQKTAARSWPRFAAAVAAAAVIALAVWNVQLGSSLRDARNNTRAAIRAMSVLNDANARHATLTGGQGTVLVALRRDGSIALAASGMPDAPAGRVYELWLLKGSAPTAATVFTPQDGTAIVTLFHPGAFDGAAITVEEAPHGTRAPTAPIIYRGSLVG